LLSVANKSLQPVTVDGAAATWFTFDLLLNTASPSVQSLDPGAVSVAFSGDPGLVLDAYVASPMWSYAGQSVPMWLYNTSELVQGGALYAVANGASELSTNPGKYEQNPLVDGAGRVAQVNVLLDGVVATMPSIGVEELVAFPVELISAPSVLVLQVPDASKVSIKAGPQSSDDNLMKYFAQYDPGANKTHVAVMFDADPDLRETSPSSLLQYSFSGNVVNQLVPESLTFSG
jgi:hypothetical protein